ncbi:hypothetical protein ACXR6G_19430 [Ancylomarina sp. YFZ004]
MKKEKSTLAGVGAALLAVLGSVTCCGAPILAGVLASVGIGASQLSFLHAIQPYLIAVALISLAIGFYRLYFKKSNSCCGTDSKEGAPNKRKSKAFLWIVSVLTVGMLIYTSNLNRESNQRNYDSNSEEIKESCCSKPQVKTTCCPSSINETSADETVKNEKASTVENQSSCCGASSAKNN